MLIFLACVCVCIYIYLYLYQYIHNLYFIISKMYIKCYSLIELVEFIIFIDIIFRFLVFISRLTLLRVLATSFVGMPCLLLRGFLFSLFQSHKHSTNIFVYLKFGFHIVISILKCSLFFLFCFKEHLKFTE
jgi:hypothetical protein